MASGMPSASRPSGRANAAPDRVYISHGVSRKPTGVTDGMRFRFESTIYGDWPR